MLGVSGTAVTVGGAALSGVAAVPVAGAAGAAGVIGAPLLLLRRRRRTGGDQGRGPRPADF